MSRKKPTKSKETCKVYLKFIEIKKKNMKIFKDFFAKNLNKSAILEIIAEFY